MNHGRSSTGIGRPRAFDVDEALEKALKVFWAKGYEGTSMNDLTTAMGINRPSLYAAFGNKEALFRKALERYREGPASYVKAALELPTARETAEAMLRGAVGMMENPDQPRGCFVTQSALACGDDAASIRQELVATRCTTLSALECRFRRAKDAGEFRETVDPMRLARYIATVMQGMSVQAASGATPEEMRGIVEQAMLAWPS